MAEQNPKSKQAKEPSVLAIKLHVYFEAKTPQEKSRASALQLGSRTVFPAKFLRFDIKNDHLIKPYLDGQLIGDISPLEKILVKNKHDRYKVVTNLINLFSRIYAYKIVVEGDASDKSTRIPIRYLQQKRLQQDELNQTISFPYIRNDRVDVLASSKDMFTSTEIKNNYRRNSCLASIIVDTFQHSDRKWELTYEILWEICCPDRLLPQQGQPYTLSLDDICMYLI
jgi:hypothetical protein